MFGCSSVLSDSVSVFCVFRAAHKLSLSRRKKSPPGSASPPGESPEPLLYTGGFSGALQLSPPAVPPCLLRAGSKVKDTPGMGKVRWCGVSLDLMDVATGTLPAQLMESSLEVSGGGVGEGRVPGHCKL